MSSVSSGFEDEHDMVPSPNVVVIICDDLGSGDLGCYGSRIRTPNLDKLAEEGTRFTHFNAAHPLCSASRAALLTGRYAGRSGTKNAIMPFDEDGMSPEETTLANLFHDARYRSICIGKWHLGIHLNTGLSLAASTGSTASLTATICVRCR